MAQTIISVSREFGSGGHLIAEKIADSFGFKFYDRRMLDEIANENNIKIEILEKYDEKPRNALLSRRVGAFSNSMEEILADMQFDYIRKRAESGESFVIVGRCAETILSRHPGLISIFVGGDHAAKVERIKKVYQLNDADAVAKCRRHDRKRKRYHNRHSNFKWGDSRYYDICINSSRLGLDVTAAVLEKYIQERLRVM